MALASRIAAIGAISAWRLSSSLAVAAAACKQHHAAATATPARCDEGPMHCVVAAPAVRGAEGACPRQLADMFRLARHCVEPLALAGHFTFSVAAPTAAGSAVSHAPMLLLHIVNRVPGDFVPNNVVYHQLRLAAAGIEAALAPLLASSLVLDDDDPSVARASIDADAAARLAAAPLAPPGDHRGKAEEAEKVNRDDTSSQFVFFPHVCARGSIVTTSEYFVILVNLKPIVDGHLLVVPRRVVGTLHELTAAEIDDFGTVLAAAMRGVRRRIQEQQPEVASRLLGFALAVQQGVLSGQTVPHLHAHVIPFVEDGVLAGEPEVGSEEAQRAVPGRSVGAMEADATNLRQFFAL